MPSEKPLFSVVMPVLNGGADLDRCLTALRESAFQDWELIVVDDGSNDGSPERALAAGARVLASGGRRGPGAARNLGAEQARGAYLFFLDADCEVHPDTLSRAAAALSVGSAPDAVFGSYDDDPSASGFVARFKNLTHHYVHQRGRPEAGTFWAGCGAVRRSTFLEVGGFDAELFPRPSIEDIELGYRLCERGFTVRLCRDVQVKHLKRWTLAGMIRTDVLDRGVPWTRLMLARGTMETDLNVTWRHRLGVGLAWILAPTLLLAPLVPWALAVAAGAAAALLLLNLDLYRFYVRRGGVAFALGAIPMHWLHYLYSGIAFVVGVLSHARTRLDGRGLASA
jgi:cellulose synthase/poly-beta-1,6-N-acetylglucosamine synthase-like glycosyltransferase